MRTGSLERKNNKFQIEKQCDIIRTVFIIKSDRSVNVQMTASLLIAVIYLIFISLGLPDSLLGSGWPTMQMYFDVPSSYAGYVSMTISFMTIISALMSPKLNKQDTYQVDCNLLNSSDDIRIVWIFGFFEILDALYFCRTIRAWSRSD